MILVVSLVACNKKPDDPTPPPEPPPGPTALTTSDYFETLWATSASIGKEEIAETDDIALGFGVELALGTKELLQGYAVHTIDIGLDVQAVVGRTKSTTNNTALKVRIYDPTDTQNAEIATMYLFANDLDNVYFDFAGKNIKVNHGFATYIWEILKAQGVKVNNSVWEKIVNDNNAFNTGAISDLLDSKFIGTGSNKKSINYYVNTIVGDFGDDWTVSKLLGGILNMAGLDKTKITGMLQGDKTVEGIVNLILPALGISSIDSLFTGNKLDIYPLLTGALGEALFGGGENAAVPPTSVTNGNVTSYNVTIDGSLLGMVLNMSAVGMSELAQMLGSGGINLGFSASDNKIKDFTLGATLTGLKTTIDNPSGAGKIDVVPELSIKINKLRVNKADTTNIVTTKVAKNQYKEQLDIHEQFSVEVKGTDKGIEIINAIDDPQNPAKKKSLFINGKIEFDVQGQVDLSTLLKPSDATVKNKTLLNARVTYYDYTKTPNTKLDLIEGSYANGKFAVKFADAIEMEKEDGSGTEWVQGYYYDCGENFDLVAWIRGLLKDAIYGNPGVTVTPAQGSAQADGEQEPTFAEKLNSALATVKKVFGIALNMVDTTDNVLSVGTNSVLGSVITFQNALVSKKADKWALQDRYQEIIHTLVDVNLDTNAPATVDACIDNIVTKVMELFDKMFPADGQKPATPIDYKAEFKALWTNVQTSVIKMVYLYGKDIRLDGVEYKDNPVIADYEQYKRPDHKDTDRPAPNANYTVDDIHYIDNIIAVLNTGVTVSGDLKAGIHASVVLKIAGVTITASNVIDVLDVAESAYKDIYALNKTAIDDPAKTGATKETATWKAITFEKNTPSQGGSTTGESTTGGQDTQPQA